MTSRLAILFLLLALPALGGCGDSGSDNGSTGGIGGTDTDAFLVSNRVRDPSGRAIFLSVLPTLEAGEIDISQAIEVSGLSRALVFEGKVFVFDGESGVVTRYVADGDGLREDTLENGARARFNLGTQQFTSAIAFINSERAYYVDIRFEDLVFVWNPTTMTRISTFPAPEVRREEFSASGGGMVVIDDFVLLPISWFNDDRLNVVETAAMVVFSASEDRVIGVIEDGRCIISNAAFAEDGAVYLMADTGGGIPDALAPPGTDFPPPCLLRWTPGAEAFDSDFYRDLEEITGYPFVQGAVSRGDGTFVTLVYTSDIDPRTLTPQELVDDRLWQWAVVDFQGSRSTLIESIPPGGVSSMPWVVDGEYYVQFFEDDFSRSSLFELDTPNATERMSVVGEFRNVARIR